MASLAYRIINERRKIIEIKKRLNPGKKISPKVHLFSYLCPSMYKTKPLNSSLLKNWIWECRLGNTYLKKEVYQIILVSLAPLFPFRIVKIYSLIMRSTSFWFPSQWLTFSLLWWQKIERRYHTNLSLKRGEKAIFLPLEYFIISCLQCITLHSAFLFHLSKYVILNIHW